MREQKEDTTWVSIVALALIACLAVACAVIYLQKRFFDRTPSSIEESKRRLNADAQRDKDMPVTVGDNHLKLTARCGMPEDMKLTETVNGQFGLYVYTDRNLPYDCRAIFRTADGIIVEIQR